MNGIQKEKEEVLERERERARQRTKGGCTFSERIIIALERLGLTRMPLNQSRSLGLGLQLHILPPFLFSLLSLFLYLSYSPLSVAAVSYCFSRSFFEVLHIPQRLLENYKSYVFNGFVKNQT